MRGAGGCRGARQALRRGNVCGAKRRPRFQRGLVHHVRAAREVHDGGGASQHIRERRFGDRAEIAYRQHVRPRDGIARQRADQAAEPHVCVAIMRADRASGETIGARDDHQAGLCGSSRVQNHFQPWRR